MNNKIISCEILFRCGLAERSITIFIAIFPQHRDVLNKKYEHDDNIITYKCIVVTKDGGEERKKKCTGQNIRHGHRHTNRT